MSGEAQDQLPAALRDRLERLPKKSGVYLFEDAKGTVIYVGKAKSLRARVRSYFTRSSDGRAFVPLLAGLLGDIKTIVTANETEALLLENNLIKEHKPRFNVMMRDDKNFLVLRLDTKAPFPRLEIKRAIDDDGARYFGPYPSASAARKTLRVVNRFFKLRTCTDRVLARRQRPCLQFQIGRCPAPCVYEIDANAYGQQVEDVTLFLRGRRDDLLKALRARMTLAADTLAFELAAHLRDQIDAVERSLQPQEVVGEKLVDQDVFALYREGDAVDIVVIIPRRGQIIGRREDAFTGQEFPSDEILSAYISQYYDGATTGQALPREILLPFPIEDIEAKAEWLSGRAQHRVTLLVPRRGHKRKLVDLARQNAQHTFETRRRKDLDVTIHLAKLQARLHLTRTPHHIECYDISQFQGDQVVASMVVMREGEPDPGSYRHFRVRGARSDDFSALYEVLSRRLRRAREGDAAWELPDLIVVDGGKGQLSSALAALRDVDFPAEIPLPDMVGLAKERSGPDAAGDERPDRVFRPHVKDPVRLRPNTTELFLLSRLRDEAHRFAIGQHRRLRQKRTLRSGLDDIPGIGKKRKIALLRTLGSVRAIQAASLGELRAVPTMTSRAAEAVFRYFTTPPPTKRPGDKEHQS
ncbi:MAG: excinuclease ABC subunit UvrC [Deltaproteobacteria bacterium]|nr:excinuclease ABC subunit UvrC [Deltaproteobacteria bacterium]